MRLEEYPKLTIIMRGYSFNQSEAILKAMEGFEKDYAVEMTLNTENALENIKKLTEEFGDKINIGAGTVRTLTDAKAAYEAGAKFLLGPHVFTKEMLAFANEKNILAIPAAMTPSEVDQMFKNGADIVKIFPAAVVSPRFFKDIQAPLGKLPLMGVGGVSADNAKDFFDNQATYLGLGSGMFNEEDIKTLNVSNLAKSLQSLLEIVK
ncbi:bifunctional 4-hydroxy-2-oxoglutarate aldolase/2-dehydro-3-deoxy-phosphogluconate aldolase [Enterococcus canintestini]|uniref:2-dehydro-3-deoxyphosphogluconate aldolase n=1 Tax=Enterococcus canintestini TaxID=317010 RepID=A0A267HVI8_9ENTE|nr:bifunctional 4-hydroxy-2-oxoglutarate aldolase/2-dehydro-3-deoxy-phosphogluconate aldolase [Enterococcus canintestini]PAB01528.1 2-dehydro-3-deoxyphosphogluconate aldolase [Enterococcus canintestini]